MRDCKWRDPEGICVLDCKICDDCEEPMYIDTDCICQSMKINVLLACEESQAVCKEFRKLGANAYSCDIQPCSGDHPEWHIQEDVTKLLHGKQHFVTMDGGYHVVDRWDVIIAFPPCTYLTVTGNRWFNVERYGDKALKRIDDREKAKDFFRVFINADCEHIAIENPVGIMSTEYRKPDQIIQPYYFGDPFEKRTCLWLKGLPLLTATNKVQPEPRIYYKSGNSMPAWYCKASNNKSAERSKIRSKTFPGIAKAMAEQWYYYLRGGATK